jgi:UDP-N-acetylmuramate dehydrogenase
VTGRVAATRRGPAAAAGAGDAALAEVAAELARRTGGPAHHHERMARHSTMRVGGPADVLFVARSAADLAAAIGIAARAGVEWLVVGRGSNLIFADSGFRGLVIVSRAEGWRIEGARFVAESGLPLARAATEAGRAGLSGLEFGLAIPGTVGGAVWANAGAHGSDVASVLEWARLMRPDGTETRETAASLAMTYRESRLKRAAEPGGAGMFPPSSPGAGEVVLEACFLLEPGDPLEIAARHAEIRRWRREHQPLDLPSAGSVFRNPPGDSAGRLIEAAGLKGKRIGGALISDRHANFIVNEGRATAADVRGLAELARAAVSGRFGVELVYEIQFAGDWSSPQEEER